MNWNGSMLVFFVTLLPLNSYSETKVNAFFTPGQEVRDVTGIRYKFRVIENECPMILFGYHRTCGSSNGTYMLESNLYAHGLRYQDGVITTNDNIQGPFVPDEASLRAAISEYFNPIHCGAKTFSPVMFPRQTYLIDAQANHWKTDMVSQTNLNQMEVAVEVSRAGLLQDYSGWQSVQPLDTNTVFRIWRILVTFGGAIYTNLYAVPDNNARYLTGYEFLEFESEFLPNTKHFKVHLWDLQMQREQESFWRHVNQWSVTRQDDIPTNYGARIGWDGTNRFIEFSNVGQPDYVPLGTVFDLSLLPATNSPPDIAVSGLSLTSVVSGDKLTLVTTVTNAGAGRAEPFMVGFFLSRDTNFDLTDAFSGCSQEMLQGLAVGAGVTVTNSLDLSCISNSLTSGAYYLLAVADFPGALAELGKANNTRAYGPLGVTCFLPSGTGTNTWQLPRDFNLEGWVYEQCPDIRPSSTNTNRELFPLPWAGFIDRQNVTLRHSGPGYDGGDESGLPFIMMDTNRQWLLLHPSSNRAASVGFVASRTASCQISGVFARASLNHQGNGVTVGITHRTNWLFYATIPSSTLLNPDNPFEGAGARPFQLDLNVVKGDQVRFLVFNGESGGDFWGDITILQLRILQGAYPKFGLAVSQYASGISLTWPSLPGEVYSVERCAPLENKWRVSDTLVPTERTLWWQTRADEPLGFFRVRLESSRFWISLP